MSFGTKTYRRPYSKQSQRKGSAGFGNNNQGEKDRENYIPLPNFKPSGLLLPLGYAVPREDQHVRLLELVKTRNLKEIKFVHRKSRNSFKIFDKAEFNQNPLSYFANNNRDQKTWYSFGVKDTKLADSGTSKYHLDFNLARSANFTQFNGSEAVRTFFYIQLKQNNKIYILQPKTELAMVQINNEVIPPNTYVELKNQDNIEASLVSDSHETESIELQYVEL
ncbi:hypothetical protein ACO0QE_000446 [Hanseniaspora vineae]